MSDKDLLEALLARRAPSSTALVRLLTADTAHLTATAPQPFARTADHLTHAHPHQRAQRAINRAPAITADFRSILCCFTLSPFHLCRFVSSVLQNFSANVQVVSGDSRRSVVRHVVAFLTYGTSSLVGKSTCPCSYGLAIKLCLLFNLWRTRLREHVVRMQDDRRMSCDAPETRLSFPP